MGGARRKVTIVYDIVETAYYKIMDAYNLGSVTIGGKLEGYVWNSKADKIG